MLVLSQKKDCIAEVNFIRACPEGYAKTMCDDTDERPAVLGISTESANTIVCLGQYESVKRCEAIIRDMAAKFNFGDRVYYMPEE